MKPSDVAETLQAMYPTRKPVFLHGPPGVGKSQLAQQAAKAADVEFLDVRLVYHDPSDLKFPLVKAEEEIVKWINSIFPKARDWKGIICLEELPQCPPLMQATAMQLTLDRRVGEYILPDGAWVIACGNRAEDRAGAHRLITPLNRRFFHIDVDVDAEDWQAWAIGANVDPCVRAFLRFKPALLHQFDPASGARSFPCPSAWVDISDVLPHMNGHLHAVASGKVGDGPAAEFVAFRQIYMDLPDPDLVLQNPTGSSVPKEPSVLYALCGALVERIRGGKLATNFIKYIGRMPDEFSVLAMQDGCRAYRDLMKAPGAPEWLRSHRDLMMAK